MMMITLLLSLMPIAGLFLMLLSGVGFIQDTKIFSSAPQEVRNVVKPRAERFKGAHAIGWLLAVFSVLLMVGAFIIGAWSGIHNDFGFRQFFIRFIVMILLLKTFDILFFDWVLLLTQALTSSRIFIRKRKMFWDIICSDTIGRHI